MLKLAYGAYMQRMHTTILSGIFREERLSPGVMEMGSWFACTCLCCIELSLDFWLPVRQIVWVLTIFECCHHV